ncbi:Pre-mRNA-splicing factor, partial [Teratosphaeriaceae sp. CCFEE 6253]
MADVELAPPPAPASPTAAYEDTTLPADPSTSLTTTSTDGPLEKVRKTKIIKRKRRPARPQQDPSTFTTAPPPQT